MRRARPRCAGTQGWLLGVAVGNHHPGADNLRGFERIYFAEAMQARGILEAVAYFDLLLRCDGPSLPESARAA